MISSIDVTSGYTSGGQEITLTGTSLNGTTTDDAVVEVDGVACVVTQSDYYELKCETAEQPSPSSASYYSGQHGLRR